MNDLGIKELIAKDHDYVLQKKFQKYLILVHGQKKTNLKKLIIKNCSRQLWTCSKK